MNPVNGQVIDDSSKLESLLDTKGKSLKFKKQSADEDGTPDGDLIYVAKGSDGRTYSAQLARKNLVISVYDSPKEAKEKKEIQEKSVKLVQHNNNNNNNKDKEDKEKEDKKEHSHNHNKKHSPSVIENTKYKYSSSKK